MRAKQQPEMRTDGTTIINGVRDANFCNTDLVPVWYESVGNYTWGKKSSGRQRVRTGGKEKNRFTTQLSIGKDGKKLIPFLIFKGVCVYICVCVCVCVARPCSSCPAVEHSSSSVR